MREDFVAGSGEPGNDAISDITTLPSSRGVNVENNDSAFSTHWFWPNGFSFSSIVLVRDLVFAPHFDGSLTVYGLVPRPLSKSPNADPSES
jgi:hypothetical protein